MLNLFPLPNAADPAHAYNDVFQRPIEQPHSDMIPRIDWNISPKTTFYAHGINEIPARGIAGTLIHAFSPNRRSS